MSRNPRNIPPCPALRSVHANGLTAWNTALSNKENWALKHNTYFLPLRRNFKHGFCSHTAESGAVLGQSLYFNLYLGRSEYRSIITWRFPGNCVRDRFGVYYGKALASSPIAGSSLQIGLVG